MGDDLFFFGCQLREQLALDYLRGNGYMVPVHGFYHIFRALYQGSAVFLYQQVAAGGVGIAYAARKGEAVALVAFGYLGGNEGASFGAGLYHEGGVADAGYDAVALHEVLPVGVGAAHELSEQSALCQHFGGGAAVYGWVDAVQTVSQYAHGVESVGQCFAMGMDVDAVSQSAHYQHVGKQGAEFLHETLAEAFAVVGGIACTYDAQDVTAVQVGRAFVEQDERGIGTFAEAGWIGFVVFGQALNLVFLGKRELGFAQTEYFRMLKGGGYLRSDSGKKGRQLAGVFEKYGRTSGSLNQVAGSYQTDAGQKGKGHAAEEFFFVHWFR